MSERLFHLQGHRGARGLRPENTLPAVEAALDAGVSSIELDIHLSADNIPILAHDPFLSPTHHRLEQMTAASRCDPRKQPPIRYLAWDDLRQVVADRNPDPRRFPNQKPIVSEMVAWFANERELLPYGIPMLTDALVFISAYAGEAGTYFQKSDEQRERAARVRVDLELKRYPFRNNEMNDGFTPEFGGALEQVVVETLREMNFTERAIIRSFDHRSIRAIKKICPELWTAVLIPNMAPADPVSLCRAADAGIYAPQFLDLDDVQVQLLKEAGLRVWPWTVNKPEHWQQLLDWGVDGITTDYPVELAAELTKRGILWE